MATPNNPSRRATVGNRSPLARRANRTANDFSPKFIQKGKEREWKEFIARAKPGSQDREYAQVVTKGTTAALKALHEGKSVKSAIELANRAVDHSGHTYQIMIHQLILFSPRREEVQKYVDEEKKRIKAEVDRLMPHTRRW